MTFPLKGKFDIPSIAINDEEYELRVDSDTDQYEEIATYNPIIIPKQGEGLEGTNNYGFQGGKYLTNNDFYSPIRCTYEKIFKSYYFYFNGVNRLNNDGDAFYPLPDPLDIKFNVKLYDNSVSYLLYSVSVFGTNSFYIIIENEEELFNTIRNWYNNQTEVYVDIWITKKE